VSEGYSTLTLARVGDLQKATRATENGDREHCNSDAKQQAERQRQRNAFCITIQQGESDFKTRAIADR